MIIAFCFIILACPLDLNTNYDTKANYYTMPAIGAFAFK